MRVEMGVLEPSRGPRRRVRHRACLLCGAPHSRATGPDTTQRVCGGCAERLEMELTASDAAACPDCGRHKELCEVMACGGAAEPRPAPPLVSLLPIVDIDQTPGELNARQVYDTPSLVQLAASIKEHGVLQPVCVRPVGKRYVLVFGNRRLRAARRAGLDSMPCLILPAADERAFLLNVIENLQRRQLSGAERIRAIERLAATKLGVREIGRRTGFDPSTISRWLKIDRSPALKKAVESELLDIGRAKVLADAPESGLADLIPVAAALSRAELARRVAALRDQNPSASSVACSPSAESRRLLRALRIVESISSVDSGDYPTLDRLRHAVNGLQGY